MSDHRFSEFSTGPVTTTGQIGTFGVGHPIFIHNIFITAGGSSTSILLRNGDATGTIILTGIIGIIDLTINLMHYFPDGCHYTENGTISLIFLYS